MKKLRILLSAFNACTKENELHTTGAWHTVPICILLHMTCLDVYVPVPVGSWHIRPVICSPLAKYAVQAERMDQCRQSVDLGVEWIVSPTFVARSRYLSKVKELD